MWRGVWFYWERCEVMYGSIRKGVGLCVALQGKLWMDLAPVGRLERCMTALGKMWSHVWPHWQGMKRRMAQLEKCGVMYGFIRKGVE